MTPPATQSQWISTFLEAQAAELGASTNTQLAYGRDLKDYADWLSRKNLTFETADQSGIEAYLIDCDAQGLAKTTRARRLSSERTIVHGAWSVWVRSSVPPIASV